MTTSLWAKPHTAKDLGAFLARLRHERGWTQDELAELLGTTRRYIYDIESGRRNLYNERLFGLLSLLGARLSIEAAPGRGDTRGPVSGHTSARLPTPGSAAAE